MLADVENALGFVLQKSGPSIDKFLEIVFEFLKTRTDFYVISDDPSKGGLGFKKGVAEKLVLRSFRMFDQIEFDSTTKECELQSEEVCTTENEVESEHRQQIKAATNTNYSLESEPSVDSKLSSEVSNRQIELVQISGDEGKQQENSATTHIGTENLNISAESEAPGIIPLQDSDTFNGSETKLYKWSQSQEDVEVKLKLPDCISNRKQLKVEILAKSLNVKICKCTETSSEENEEYVAGELFDNVNCSSSYWNFEPKKRLLIIYLEKLKPLWWKRLLLGGEESDLDMRKLDTTMNLHDLPEGDKATIDQLQYDQLCKLKGLPTVKERQNEELLKKAWNANGSPFGHTPFDPSTVKFN